MSVLHRCTELVDLYSHAAEGAWSKTTDDVPIAIRELSIDGSRTTEQLLAQGVSHTAVTSAAASGFTNGQRIKRSDGTEYEIISARWKTLPAPGHTTLSLQKRGVAIT